MLPSPALPLYPLVTRLPNASQISQSSSPRPPLRLYKPCTTRRIMSPITRTWSSGLMNVTTGPVRIFRPRFVFCWHSSHSDTHPQIVICTAKRQNLHFPSEYWYLFFIVRIVSFLKTAQFDSCSDESLMWFKVLRYRMEGNGTHSTSIVIFAPLLNPFPLGRRSKPKVYTVVLNWAHGRFVFNGNGSRTLIPVADGYQQIQEPCSANSDFTEDYHLQEMYQSWQIFLDPVDGPKFHLFAFDGSHQNRQYIYFHKRQTCCPPNNSGTPPMRRLPS